MSRALAFLIMLLTLIGPALAAPRIEHFEPASWWVGFKDPTLQVMVHRKGAGGWTAELDHPGVTLEGAEPGENPNYLFLDLRIARDAKTGPVTVRFKENGRVVARRNLDLKAREPNSANRQGFGPQDAIYLITPDRFANGDPANDSIRGMKEAANRALPGGRHGGDIQGVIDRLDYIAGLGFTQVWLNPLLENDQPSYSYHGYATTDFYRVDARYGSNADMRRLSDAARAKGVGLIMDMIVNHVGSQHWWMRDPPAPGWINFGGKFSQTNHIHITQMDPHASQRDKKQFADGWFVDTMPDLNQRDARLARYLIQNGIWWIEYAGLTGVRMDTYPYPDKAFMAEWSRRVMEEYPNFTVVGEEWTRNPAMVAYWQKGKTNLDGYVSHLPSLMDFPLQDMMRQALIDRQESGFPQAALPKLHEALGTDFIYPDPDKLVVFPDNHDMDRVLTQLGGDVALARIAVGYVATVRGIPQIYYGTEVLMDNPGTSDHGIIRSDFPGGFPGDAVNAFTGAGLSAEKRAFQDFTRTLFTWRRSQPAVQTGKLIHFAPETGAPPAGQPDLRGLYVYGRLSETDGVLVAINKAAEAKTVPVAPYAEILRGRQGGVDVLSGARVDLTASLALAPRSITIIDLD